VKITIQPTTGELSFDIDAHNNAEVEQAIAFALGVGHRANGQNPAPVRHVLVFADDEDGEMAPEDLIAPAPPIQQSGRPWNPNPITTDDDRVVAALQTREQRETWLYLRRNDRVRGVSVSGLAHRFKLSSTAASARACALMNLGFAVRTSKGYYRAIAPKDD
jgi:hypothetical protein